MAPALQAPGGGRGAPPPKTKKTGAGHISPDLAPAPAPKAATAPTERPKVQNPTTTARQRAMMRTNPERGWEDCRPASTDRCKGPVILKNKISWAKQRNKTKSGTKHGIPRASRLSHGTFHADPLLCTGARFLERASARQFTGIRCSSPPRHPRRPPSCRGTRRPQPRHVRQPLPATRLKWGWVSGGYGVRVRAMAGGQRRRDRGGGARLGRPRGRPMATNGHRWARHVHKRGGGEGAWGVRDTTARHA